jgi:hypothetical protein
MLAQTGDSAPEAAEEYAVRLLEHATSSYLTLAAELKNLPPAAKSAIWKNIVALARVISRGVHCRSGDIIWGRPEPFPPHHSIAVLAEIDTLAESLERAPDSASQAALMTLQIMNLVFHAETIAEGEDARKLARELKVALGDAVDEIMEQ